MLFQLVPECFSYLINQNNSNWKKLLGFRSMQEKLEIFNSDFLYSFYAMFIHTLTSAIQFLRRPQTFQTSRIFFTLLSDVKQNWVILIKFCCLLRLRKLYSKYLSNPKIYRIEVKPNFSWQVTLTFLMAACMEDCFATEQLAFQKRPRHK